MSVADHREPANATAEGSAHWKLFMSVAQFNRAITAQQPDADAIREAGDQVEMAAREVVRDVEQREPEHRPAGWDDNPVHGKPDDPEWAAHREHTCGKCGETFGSNFQPGEVDCPECDARLCSSCGHWEGGEE